MKQKIKLSGRELDVMNVLWEAGKPLTARNITEYNHMLSINTVSAVLKSLLKKGYIQVSEIVYSGTVLTRSYLPVLDANEYLISQLPKSTTGSGISAEGIIAALLRQEDADDKTIEKLEYLLKEYEQKLKIGK